MPTIDFDTAKETDIPVMDIAAESPVEAPQLTLDVSYNPFAGTKALYSPPRGSSASSSRSSSEDWNKFYDQLLPKADTVEPAQSSLFEEDSFVQEEVGGMHLQYRGQYIVSASNSGLMLVDQHRAHVRILYDRYIAQMAQRENVTQGLLFPELLTLPPSDAQIMEQIMDDVRSLGFDVSSIGGGSFSVNGLPSGIEGLNPIKLLADMVGAVQDGKTPDLSESRHRIALSLARSAAIVEGQVLSQEEMDVLMSDLLRSTNPNISPDGKTIVAVLKHDSIARMFA
jgi:DNA mismatch repair protein MutL